MHCSINLVSWDNGGGLRTDVDVLAELLAACGCDVRFNGRSSKQPASATSRMADGVNVRVHHAYAALTTRPAYDANLFLESIDSDFIPYGRVNCLIPNPEWFRDENRAHLTSMDWVLCKTRGAVDTFQRLTANARYLGFSSMDRRDPDTPWSENLSFLHAAGRSLWKGTATVVDVWRQHPEWPRLYVLRHPTMYGGEPAQTFEPATNIEFITERLDDLSWRRYQNSCLVHVCPSEAEGFGHLIGESMSCGAVVITTDGAPMNELITPERGVLVRAARSEPMALATRCFVDPVDLERQVGRVLAMSDDERRTLGERARLWYDTERERFAAAIRLFVSDVSEASRVPRARRTPR